MNTALALFGIAFLCVGMALPPNSVFGFILIFVGGAFVGVLWSKADKYDGLVRGMK